MSTTVAQLIEYLQSQPKDSFVFVNGIELDLEGVFSHKRAILYRKQENSNIKMLTLMELTDKDEACARAFKNNELIVNSNPQHVINFHVNENDDE